MKKILLTILLIIVGQGLLAQRFNGNTVLPGTDIEFIFRKVSSQNCTSKYRTHIYTPTLRKSFNPNDFNSEGYTYKVELFDNSNRKISSKIIYPKNITQTISGNWYQYTIDSNVGSGYSYGIRVTLVANRYLTLNVGGVRTAP